MWRFIQAARENHGMKGADDYQSLYAWSVDNFDKFWEACWDFVGIEASVGYEKVNNYAVNFSRFAADTLCLVTYTLNTRAGTPTLPSSMLTRLGQ